MCRNDRLSPYWSRTAGKNVFSDLKFGFLIFGERSKDRFAKSRAPAMGTVRVNMSGS